MTKNKIKIALLTMAVMPLLACSTLSREECLAGNWQAIGYNDGVAGYSAGWITRHSKACMEYQVTPDTALWEQGRQEGLKRYCTVDNAVRLGKSGSSINQVCPFEQQTQLNQINDKAKTVYQLNADLEKLSKEQQKLRDELVQLSDLNYQQLQDQGIRHKIQLNYTRITLLDRDIYQKQRELDHAQWILQQEINRR